MKLTRDEVRELIKLIEVELDKSKNAETDELYVRILTKLVIQYTE